MKLRLRRWRGYEPMMIDSRIRSRERGFGGLTMGFYPGEYRIDDPIGRAVYVHENAFWLLEPAIIEHSPRYARPLSYYGVTAIYQNEWAHILQEWSVVKSAAERANLPIILPELRSIPRDARKLFLRDFKRNCFRFSRMTSILIAWIETQLTEVEEITILGI